MTAYTWVLALHVMTAVLGIGQLGAMGLMASSASTGGTEPASAVSLLRRLARVQGVSLGLMFVSGMALVYWRRGLFPETWWFRGSMLLFIVLGALMGRLRRSIRAREGQPHQAADLARISRLVWSMGGVVALLVLAMVTKPF